MSAEKKQLMPSKSILLFMTKVNIFLVNGIYTFCKKETMTIYLRTILALWKKKKSYGLSKG